MQPSDLYFCALDGDLYGEDPKTNVIVFAPRVYWEEHQCLPDFFFADQMENIPLPGGYNKLLFMEECAWITTKSKEDIRVDLTAIGFQESLDMAQFLTWCMG